MRSRDVLAAVMAPPVVLAQWWKGAPDCAQSCLSSAFSAATSAAAATSTASSAPSPPPFWPAQSAYCDDPDTGGRAGSCLSSACAATPSLWTSYSSLSSSLCGRWASCTSSAATGSNTDGVFVTTVTYPAGPVTWAAPGGWPSSGFGGWGGGGSSRGPWGHGGGGGGGGYGPHGGGAGGGYGGPPPGGNDTDLDGDGDGDGYGGPGGGWYSRYASEWASAYSASKTWAGGVATITVSRGAGGAGGGADGGCGLFAGSPWFVGPRCGWNGRGGFDGWVGWGAGWSWGPTTTETVTLETTITATGTGASGVGTALATVALAVSGDYTTSVTLGAAATDGAESGAGGSATGSSGGSSGGGDGDTGSAARRALGPPPALFGFGFGADGLVTGLWGSVIVALVGVVAFL
ncbi:hypothetical protein SLS62_000018 [Diatrype stigma]|uniref:Uncharacterized protein n=1 Tax=Diatrype stigma TaxID=117547 RepID=A0AAN9V3B3_9PEZI